MGVWKPKHGLEFGPRVTKASDAGSSSSYQGGLVENVAQPEGHNAGLCPEWLSTMGGGPDGPCRFLIL